MTKTKKSESGVRLILVLFLISAIVALLLGLTNYATKDRIETIRAEKTAAAMREVLPADEYRRVEYSGDDARVTELYETAGGWVVRLNVPGSQDKIDMLVGVGADGTVSGVAIVDMAETAGLGDKAAAPEWCAQFVGKSGAIAITKDGGEIDAITGATVTSRAVTDGVSAALAAVLTVKEGSA